MPKVIGFDPVDLGFGGMINYSGSDNSIVLDDVKDGNYPTLSSGNRFIRMDIVNNVSPNYLEVMDLHYLVGNREYPTVAMSGNSLPVPYVASASSIHSGSFQPYLAFNNTTARWHATSASSHWIQIDLGPGSSITPTGFVMTVFSGSGDRRPGNITVSGSSTGAFAGEQTVFYTGTNLASLFTYSVETRIDF